MWIFAKEGFLSIVQHRDHPELLVVRSRFEGDIDAIFPGSSVVETPNADYRYRTILHRRRVKPRIAGLVDELDYPNFKNEILDRARHRTYSRVWAVMAGAQDAARQACFSFDDPTQIELDFWGSLEL